LDPAVAHLGDELEVVPLGAVHPHHVVEEQLVARVRREPEGRQPRRADHHSPQPTRLRPHADARTAASFHGGALPHRLGHRQTLTKPWKNPTTAATDRIATTPTRTFSTAVNTSCRLSLRA